MTGRSMPELFGAYSQENAHCDVALRNGVASIGLSSGLPCVLTHCAYEFPPPRADSIFHG